MQIALMAVAKPIVLITIIRILMLIKLKIQINLNLLKKQKQRLHVLSAKRLVIWQPIAVIRLVYKGNKKKF